jgi:hypothetical protein
MGQAYSLLKRLCWRHAPEPPWSRAPHRENGSILLQQPTDIFLHISKQLTRTSAVALSLTCKAAFVLLSPRVRTCFSNTDRECFLLFLEKDVGDRVYYCHFCSKLHSFSSYWGPNAQDIEPWRFNTRDCRYSQLFWLANTGSKLGYHHVRLVMNRHLLGPPRGLPLWQLQYETTGLTRPPCWVHKWTGKVIGNELFLSATHTISHSEGSAEALRDAVDYHHFDICNHVDCDGRYNRISRRVPELQRGSCGGSSSSSAPPPPLLPLPYSCRARTLPDPATHV